ncbi:hypothetical protein BDK51DRAFT_31275 [Blyttiomyces helicus]|uniref:Pentacotripeptide-repeat region of PRORP domain-containing protein n=1 Tax=Blyttiomyces helicus TaxID=388810 RepID=A0A4P9W5X6_9FUNG|nr:hypothetical protein BDK51DRAFT_31275 [Blyttiomyces helicus]|eukprot:RKO87684.1 hypothetical protein BDK51DRAFT_31275 [Blyttiomyces helicus]
MYAELGRLFARYTNRPALCRALIDTDPVNPIWLRQLASAYSHTEFPRECEAVLRHLVSIGTPMDARDCLTILITWRKVYYKESCTRFDEMLDSGGVPDESHYEEMMLQDEDVPRGDELVSSMVSAGFPVDSETVEWLVRARDAVRNGDGAESIFEAWDSKGITLSVRVFYSVWNALANAGYPERVQAWADKMLARGYNPEPRLSSMLVRARIKADDLETADRATAKLPIDPDSALKVARRFIALVNPARALIALARIPPSDVSNETVAIAMWVCSRAIWPEAARQLKRPTPNAPGVKYITALTSRPRLPLSALVSSASAAPLLDVHGFHTDRSKTPSKIVPAMHVAWQSICA